MVFEAVPTRYLQHHGPVRLRRGTAVKEHRTPGDFGQTAVKPLEDRRTAWPLSGK
ncbi:MAG: hypothetical protein ACM4D3_11810 [Candidatus Sericytochromatia bacterium]